MHLRNNWYLLLLVLATTLSLAAQSSSPAAPTPPADQNVSTQQTSPQQSPPVSPSQKPTTPPQNPPAGDQGRAPDSQQGDTFTFRATVNNVILHATVVDDKGKLITNLDKNAFTVFEDGVPQKLVSFRHEDIPVALGIVIDNSGSMRDKRPKVNQAAINLVKASNPDDEVFVVNFNDESFLDQDYTDQVPLLKEALDRIEARGGTALYDAVVAAADHLKENTNAKLAKKVLLVVTDGEDNASRESLEQAIRHLQAENGPTVYTIGILGEERARRAKRALSAIAEQTGGVAFFPKDLSDVDQISQEVAHDIRNQYTLVYKPSVPQDKGGYRTVKVEARANGYKHLQVRTRSGYYPGQERAALQ